jgi:hypothetical protein
MQPRLSHSDSSDVQVCSREQLVEHATKSSKEKCFFCIDRVRANMGRSEDKGKGREAGSSRSKGRAFNLPRVSKSKEVYHGHRWGSFAAKDSS